MGATRRHLAVDERGYANLARQVRSPNRDARPAGTAISLVVVHGISLPPGEFGGDGIARLFTNRLDPQAHPYYVDIARIRVSAHFLVRRDGELVQFVGCFERAWHAGASTWNGRAACNDFSIGIELEGTDDIAYAAAQYTMLARLDPGASPHVPDRRHRRPQRHRPRAEDRPRSGIRLGPSAPLARPAFPLRRITSAVIRRAGGRRRKRWAGRIPGPNRV